MAIVEIQTKLSIVWIALMLTYLLGDVLRIFYGDFTPRKIGDKEITQGVMLGIAILMVTPIVMIFLSLILHDPVNRWTNMSVAVFFFLFNVIGLPSYPSAYDKFLTIVGLGINMIIVWYAWRWEG